jgi:hypothetical protein
LKLAELFVELKIKGADDVSRALKNLKSGMGDVESGALGVIGAVSGIVAGVAAGAYAFKKFGEQSNQTGFELEKFRDLTGDSAADLQNWQLLALKAGASADDMKDSMYGARQKISDLMLGKGPPGNLGALVNLTGFDVNKIHDLNYVMGRIQNLAQQTKGKPYAMNLLNDLVSNKNVQFALMQNTPLSTAGPQHAYTEREANRLKNMKIQWGLLADEISKTFGHLNSKFGPSVLKDIVSLTHSLLKLVEALAGLAEKFSVVKKLDTLTNFLLSDASKPASKAEHAKRMKALTDFAAPIGSALLSAVPEDKFSRMTGGFRTVNNHMTANVTVNGAHDPKTTAKEVKRQVSEMLFGAQPQFQQGK